ncbi:hypothetical protein V1264_006955 [Littorina saxatilis]|uniref:K Homology domain-containing protein n=1 Tax=Littorina saxatilis TaxID=31220 RepID=A0AAN9G6F0_9CAEN
MAEDSSNAFASALARARQIAAKINQPGAGDAQPQGIKRPFEDEAHFGEPESKKSAPDSALTGIGAQLQALANQSSVNVPTEAAQAAQEAAARINRQLGLNPADPGMQPQKPGPHPGMGMVSTENFHVPDKMVGLIIGKGGEQITRLQAESGCKVQIAPDSGGMPDRPCTLTGSPHSISICKSLMQQIIDRAGNSPHGMDGMGGGGGGGGGPMVEGNSVVEMSIPGTKVGLIIGKGGETIRQLQERANVKMVMIQDSNAPTAQDKPLRITGEPGKCQRAKEMVLELLAEKDMQGGPGGGGGMGTFNNFDGMGHGGGGPGGMEIPVPRQAVGLVIGKGGEMIKKIQTETGAKVQFKPDDGQSEDRQCAITGSPDKVQHAISMIHELLANANVNDVSGSPLSSMEPAPLSARLDPTLAPPLSSMEPAPLSARLDPTLAPPLSSMEPAPLSARLDPTLAPPLSSMEPAPLSARLDPTLAPPLSSMEPAPLSARLDPTLAPPLSSMEPAPLSARLDPTLAPPLSSMEPAPLSARLDPTLAPPITAS